MPRPTPDDRGTRDASGGGGSARGKASFRCFSRHTSCRRAALTRINCTCACRSAQHGRCWQLNDGVAGGSSITIGPSYTTSCISGRAAMRRSSMPIDLRSTSAAEHTDCVLRTLPVCKCTARKAVVMSIGDLGGGTASIWEGKMACRRGQATPCHREYVGRQQQPCCRWGPLRPRLFVPTRHPRLHAALAAPARPALFRGEPILAWAGGSGCDGLGRLRELV